MISIVFSTFNGGKTLPSMLSALVNITPPLEAWEIVVVNNNSTDDTLSILKEYQQQLPLKILFEEKKGKNQALNTAIKHVQGDIVVLTDDDIIPQTDWIIKIREIVDKEPSFSIFGGKIEPFWSIPPKLWNIEWIQTGIVYGITPDSNKSGKIGAGSIWGANMVIRRDIFDKGYRFDTAIGPDGTNNYVMGSETSFTFMLEKEGYQCWFEPSFIVKHIIKESQMSPQWVLSRAIRFGRGEAKKRILSGKEERHQYLFGVPRYLFRKRLEYELKKLMSLISFDKEYAFKLQWEINFLKGLIIENRLHNNQ